VDVLLQYQIAGVGEVVMWAKLLLLAHWKKYFEKADLQLALWLFTKSHVQFLQFTDCMYEIAQASILEELYDEQALFAYIQSVAFAPPPLADSARTRQNTFWPAAGVGPPVQGRVREFVV
jgi:hypothetical protein